MNEQEEDGMVAAVAEGAMSMVTQVTRSKVIAWAVASHHYD